MAIAQTSGLPRFYAAPPTGPSVLRSQSAGHLRKGFPVPRSTAEFRKAGAAPELLRESERDPARPAARQRVKRRMESPASLLAAGLLPRLGSLLNQSCKP